MEVDGKPALSEPLINRKQPLVVQRPSVQVGITPEALEPQLINRPLYLLDRSAHRGAGQGKKSGEAPGIFLAEARYRLIGLLCQRKRLVRPKPVSARRRHAQHLHVNTE